MEAKARAERSSLVACVAARTRSGTRKAANEDAIGFAGAVSVMASGSLIELEANIDGGIVCLLADGAGGHPGGDHASRIVVEYILAQADNRLRSSEELGRAISSAHLELRRVMATNQQWDGMGSTVAVLSLSVGGAVIGNVGDSSIFEIDSQGLVTLSVADNPPRPPWMPAGRPITGLTQMLGGPDAAAQVEPHLGRFPLEAGMRLLMCSDGLTDALGEDEIDSIIRRGFGRDTPLVDALIESATAQGATDDISVVLVRLDEGSGATVT